MHSNSAGCVSSLFGCHASAAKTDFLAAHILAELTRPYVEPKGGTLPAGQESESRGLRSICSRKQHSAEREKTTMGDGIAGIKVSMCIIWV